MYTNTKSFLILYNSLIISLFTYCIELHVYNLAKQITKLNTLLNKCMHKLLGFYSYRLSTTTILRKLSWISYPQMVIACACKSIHKIASQQKPLALSQYIAQSMINIETNRKVRISSLKRVPLSEKTRKSFLYRPLNTYNKLP